MIFTKKIPHISYILLLFLLQISLYANYVDPYEKINYFKLQNGLQVYILTDKKTINTQIQLEVNVGTDIENKDNAGISHLVEHLLFRDQRIPHKDYLDYIKDHGATDVNGYTGRYTTGYVATIDSNKSEWILQTFAQMIFDKDINEDDLEIEKKALQIEIGEIEWYHPVTNLIKTMLKGMSKLYPKTEDIYIREFGLKKLKELPTPYTYKSNNYKFKLEEVLKHYKTYYYPKNMTLKIVGNFDLLKMKELVKTSFEQYTMEGTKHTKKPPYNATLNNKPHTSIKNMNANYAYLGTKYILDDYKKYLIVDSYTEYLATVTQQNLRNKLGQTYSVSSFEHSKLNAEIVGVSFSSLHKTFYNSINIIEEKIKSDVKNIPQSAIQAALDQSRLYYTSLEHDSNTLMELVDSLQYLHKYHNNYQQSPYKIFESISPTNFQNIISNVFQDNNRYSYIYYDYYFFPYDTVVLALIMLFLFVYTYRKSYIYFYLKKGNVMYTKREILWSRKLNTWFIGLVRFIFIFMIATFISGWLEYHFYDILFSNPYYSNTMEAPYHYFVSFVSFIFFMLVFMLIMKYLFKNSYAKIEVTDNALNLVGSHLKVISKNKISKSEISSWKINMFFKTYGFSFLFWKPLVSIVTKDEVIYLRTSNANHLHEDITKWRESN